MEKNNNLFGTFVCVGFDPNRAEGESTKILNKFTSMTEMPNGVLERLEKLEYSLFGRDIELILLQFFLEPTKYEIENYGGMSRYSKKEKSLSFSFMITSENFFKQPKEVRESFILNNLLQYMEPLEKTVKRNKLDTDVMFLKKCIQKILNQSLEEN